MKNNSRKFFVISLISASFFSFLFVLVASNKNEVQKFDIYLGAVWVFVLSFIVVLSLVHMFKKERAA